MWYKAIFIGFVAWLLFQYVHPIAGFIAVGFFILISLNEMSKTTAGGGSLSNVSIGEGPITEISKIPTSRGLRLPSFRIHLSVKLNSAKILEKFFPDMKFEKGKTDLEYFLEHVDTNSNYEAMFDFAEKVLRIQKDKSGDTGELEWIFGKASENDSEKTKSKKPFRMERAGSRDYMIEYDPNSGMNSYWKFQDRQIDVTPKSGPLKSVIFELLGQLPVVGFRPAT